MTPTIRRRLPTTTMQTAFGLACMAFGGLLWTVFVWTHPVLFYVGLGVSVIAAVMAGASGAYIYGPRVVRWMRGRR